MQRSATPESQLQLHNGVSCDKTGMSPIIGLQYKLAKTMMSARQNTQAVKKNCCMCASLSRMDPRKVTPEEIEMANMGASASATGRTGQWGQHHYQSLVPGASFMLPGLPSAASAVAASPPADDVDGNQPEGNEAAQRLQEEQKVEKVVDIAVSNWGTIARSSKNNVYWWGRRPHNPSSAAAAAVPHSRTQGQSNIAKDFKAVLSKYNKAVAASESDDSGRSGRGPSAPLSSLKKIKSEIFELAGDSDAYSARLMQLGVGTPGADALRSAVSCTNLRRQH